jgi:phenylalanyl-tRNA synthetase beta chain
VLESACFNGASVPRRPPPEAAHRRFHALREIAGPGQYRARPGAGVELLQELSPGIRLVGGLADQRKEIPPPPPILLPLDWLERKLGKDIAPRKCATFWSAWNSASRRAAARVFSVTVPSWRATKDISHEGRPGGRSRPHDRLRFHRPRPPAVLTTVPPANPERASSSAKSAASSSTRASPKSTTTRSWPRRMRARSAWTRRTTSRRQSHRVQPVAAAHVAAAGAARQRAREQQAFRQLPLFEIGREIHKQPQGLPREIPHLAAAIYSKGGDGVAGLFEMKRAAECLMPGAQKRGRPAASPTSIPRARRKSTGAALWWAGSSSCIRLWPRAARPCWIWICTRSGARAQREEGYTPIRRYPSSAFDLSVVAGMRELVGDLRDKLAALAGPLLESIEYLREYAGPPLPEGTKSVSFR